MNTNVHYRLVLGTVGYGLKGFKGTDELLHATYDAFQGKPACTLLRQHISNSISYEGRS